MKSYIIHFIRHGVTDANLEGRYVGSTDVPLSQNGIAELRKLGSENKYPGAAVYYSSPLKRCLQTCKELYDDVTPIIVPGLQECNFGKWEGKSAKDLENDEDFKKWLDNAQQTPPPGGESGTQFAKRVCETFEKLVEGMMRTGTTSAVVFTHGGVIMTLLSAYGLPRAGFFDWIVGNGCGYSVRITPGLWMRDRVFEVYAKVPAGLKRDEDYDQSYIIDIAREAADRAYGNIEGE